MSQDVGSGTGEVPPPTKPCPVCGKTVIADALFCPYCGHGFQAGGVPPPPGQWVPPAPGAPAPTVPPQTAMPPPTNGYAIAALATGIAGYVVLPLIGHVLALVFGYTARAQIDRFGGAEGGRGMAVTGIILGWVGIGLSVLLLIVGVMLAVAVGNAHGAQVIINGSPIAITW